MLQRCYIDLLSFPDSSQFSAFVNLQKSLKLFPFLFFSSSRHLSLRQLFCEVKSLQSIYRRPCLISRLNYLKLKLLCGEKMEFEHHLPQELKSIPAVAADSEQISACFDCSICLDFACDPVVTLCGHLYCWPCIYKWLQFQGSSLSSNDCTQCPVCKSEISHSSIVPLYGRGKILSEDETHDKAASTDTIPPRPSVPATLSPLVSSHQQLPQHNSQESYQDFFHPHAIYGRNPFPALSNIGSITTVCHPVVGMFGEMVYARVFGNSERLYAYPNSYYRAGSSNARLRRQEIIIHKSLSRVTFFLFCCLLLCLLLF